MKKITGLAAFIICLTIYCFAGKHSPGNFDKKPDADSLYFAGLIDQHYPFTMVLKLTGDKLAGWYAYDSKKQKINIIGSLKDQGFEIAEYVGKDTTGFFSGIMKDQHHIDGNWRKKRDSFDGSRFFELIEKKYFEAMNALISATEKNKAIRKIKIITTTKDGDLRLNENYIKNSEEHIKAILAFYSTQSGTDCWWDGDNPDKSYSNLSCTFTKALGLGFQCSDKQKNIIKKWFVNDQVLLSEADNCYSAPNAATVQDVYNELVLEILQDQVIVKYETAGVNMREDYNWNFKGIGIYKLYSQKIVREYYK